MREDYFEVMIADPETDAAVPPGQLGEILVRPRVPFGFMAGYHELPDERPGAICGSTPEMPAS